MYMNNDNYLQDFYNYNQMPNNFNPYMNNGYMPNQAMMQNQSMTPNSNMMQAQGTMMNGMYNPNMYSSNNTSDITNFYPSTYRVINPVVSRVVQNSNYQFLNEDTINNMVDTVYSIVDGQIDYREEESPLQTQTQSQTSSSTNQNGTQTQRQTSTETTRMQTNNVTQSNRSDNLLRDLIKILIIKELLSRRNNPYMNF